MKRHAVVVAAAAAVAALVLSACSGGGSSGGSSSAGAGSTPDLNLGILQEPASWDPATSGVGHQFAPYQLAYDTLIRRNTDGTYAPMLASEWDYTDPAKTTMQLTLRSGVTFSDGAPFDANAVKANLEHFAAAKGRQAIQAASIETVTVKDATTVDIALKAANPAFEYYLSQNLGLMASPQALTGQDITRTPAGTGPYTMVAAQSVVGQQYVFVARQGYWDPSLQKFGKVTLKLLPDATARVNALASKQIDATLLDAKTSVQADATGLKQLAYPTDWQGLLIFDRDGKTVPALGSPKVRQALNYAFDRQTMLKNFAGGKGAVTSQVFGPASEAYVDSLDSTYTYDPAKAKALLAEAGYPDGFSMTMPVIPGASDAIMTAVQQQLAAIGVKVELTSVPIADYQALLGQGKFPAAWFSLFQGPAWVAVNQIVAPQALYNPYKSTNADVAALVDKVGSAPADDTTAAQDLNEYLTQNAWFVPWFRPDQLYYFDAAKLTVTARVQQAVPSIYDFAPAA